MLEKREKLGSTKDKNREMQREARVADKRRAITKFVSMKSLKSCPKGQCYEILDAATQKNFKKAAYPCMNQGGYLVTDTQTRLSSWREYLYWMVMTAPSTGAGDLGSLTYHDSKYVSITDIDEVPIAITRLNYNKTAGAVGYIRLADGAIQAEERCNGKYARRLESKAQSTKKETPHTVWANHLRISFPTYIPRIRMRLGKLNLCNTIKFYLDREGFFRVIWYLVRFQTRWSLGDFFNSLLKKMIRAAERTGTGIRQWYCSAFIKLDKEAKRMEPVVNDDTMKQLLLSNKQSASSCLCSHVNIYGLPRS